MTRGGETNKEKAVHFLQMAVSGQIDEAYATYVDMQGKHHNAYYPAGFAALQEGMKEDHLKVSDKTLTVINALEDGDRVAVHSHLRRGKDDISVVHLFRFRDGRIVEMWDVGQIMPADSPNQDGEF